MAIKSLNEIYKRNELFYMCNACGDVNDPNIPHDLESHMPEEVMTPEEQELYDNYWTEGGGCQMYVLRIKGKAAMGLCYLFDTEWAQDIVREKKGISSPVTEDDINQVWMLRMFSAVFRAAEKKIQKLVRGCDIYLGDWTDPDGHEMLVVVPYEMRDQIENISKMLYEVVYDAVEKAF